MKAIYKRESGDKKLLKKTVAIIVSISLVMTSVIGGLAFSYGNLPEESQNETSAELLTGDINLLSGGDENQSQQTVNQEASVYFTTTTPTRMVGQQGNFVLHAQSSNPEVGCAIIGTINLPIDAQKYIVGFVNTGEKVDNAQIWEYEKNSNVQLIVPEDGQPYLKVTVENYGVTVSAPISFRVPQTGAGCMTQDAEEPNLEWKVQVDLDDINVSREDGSEMGPVDKQGGSMSFYGTYTWNNVTKTVTPETVTLSGKGSLTEDLVYIVSNTRKDTQEESGELFSGFIEITDKLTLPETLSFATGIKGEFKVTSSVSGTNSQSQRHKIYFIPEGKDEKLLATVEQINGESMVSTSLKDISFVDEKTLQFTYVQEATYDKETEVGQYTSEMIAPKYRFILQKDAVKGDPEDKNLKGSTIKNQVNFKATAWENFRTAQSTADCETILDRPIGDFSIQKTASTSYNDAGEMYVTYTMTVKNTGALHLDRVVVTDPLPSCLIADPAKDSKNNMIAIPDDVTVKGDANSGYTLSWDVTDLSAGDSESKSFTVKVDNTKIKDGETFKNTAKGTYNNTQKTASVTKKYTPGFAKVNLSKSVKSEGVNKTGKGTITEGKEVVYTITAQNVSSVSDVVTITDSVPEWIIPKAGSSKLSVSGKILTSSGSTRVKLKANSFTIEGNVVTLKPTTIKAEEKIVIYITGRLKDGAYDGVDNSLKEIENIATLTGEKSGKKTARAIFKIDKRQPVFDLEKEQDKASSGGVAVTNVKAEYNATSDIYKYGYRIILKNNGDDYWGSDKKTVTDVMSGGLQPLAVINSDSGTATGTYTKPDGQKAEIKGTWTRAMNQKTGFYDYTLVWKLLEDTDIDKGESVEIAYNAYINVANFEVESEGGEIVLREISPVNTASAFGKTSGGVGMTFKAALTADKKITKVNGVTLDEPTDHYDIHAKDEVTYQLTIENSGSVGVNIEIIDVLPYFSEKNQAFAWEDHIVGYTVNGENTTDVKGKSRVVEESLITTGEITRTTIGYRPVYIEANETIIIEITLRFGNSSKEFKDVFGPLATDEPDDVVNVLNVQNVDTKINVVDKYTGKSQSNWTSEVTHDIAIANLNIKKSQNKVGVRYLVGETIEYTISDFDTLHPADEVKVTETLKDVVDYASFESIFAGEYKVAFADGSRTTYKMNFLDENAAVLKSVDLNPTDKTQATMSAADIPAGTKYIQWDFGNVDSLEIITAPTLKMVVDKLKEGGSVQNLAEVTWNEDGKVTDETLLDIYYKDALAKKAYDKKGNLLGEEETSLSVGDNITYKIEYTNFFNEALDLNDGTQVKFTDYLPTEGLEKGTYSVTYTIYDEDGNIVATETDASGIKITDSDISSSKAKKIEFDFPGAVDELLPKQKLEISYAVKLGSNYASSQQDYYYEDHVNWGFNDNMTLSEEPINTSLAHNRIVVWHDGFTLMDETGFHYIEGENKLLIRKDVLGYGNLIGNTHMGKTYWMASSDTTKNNYGSYYYALGEEDPNSTNGVVYTYKGTPENLDWKYYQVDFWGDTYDYKKVTFPSGDINVGNTTKDLQYWNMTPAGGKKGTTSNFFNAVPTIRYGLVISNDSLSTEAFTIDSVIDYLPSNAYFPSTSDSEKIQTKAVYKHNRKKTGRQSWQSVSSSIVLLDESNNMAYGDSVGSKTVVAGNHTLTEKSLENTKPEKVITLPKDSGMSYLKDVNVNVAYDNATTNSKSQQTMLFTDDSGEKIVLEPGEAIVLTYMVPVKRNDNQLSWRNKAELNISPVDKDEFNAEFSIVSNNSSYDSVISSTNEKAGVLHNEGWFTKVSSTKFTSQVNVYRAQTTMGVDKVAKAKIEGLWDEETTLTELRNAVNNGTATRTELANNVSLDFFDAVEWNIDISTTYPQNGYILEDTMASPYRIVTAKDSKGRTIVGYTSDNKAVYGTLTDVKDSSGNKTGTKITFDTSKGTALSLGEGNSGKKSIKIYTLYDGDKLISDTYKNTVFFKPSAALTVTVDKGTAKDGGATDDASVFPIFSGGTDSKKYISINKKEDGATKVETVHGESSKNYVSAEISGENVLYTLQVVNDSGRAYNDLTVIDRFPFEGDRGVVNASASRKSEFSLYLDEDEAREYLTTDGVVEYQIVGKDEEADDTGWIAMSNKDFLVTTRAFNSSSPGYSVADWGDGAVPSDWKSFDVTQSDDYTAMRFDFDTLPAKSKLLIRFTMTVGDDAEVSETAWNSFGYAFNVEGRDKRYYAEPPKVGVTIDGTSIVGIKKWNDGSNDANNRLSPKDVKLSLYSYVEEGDELQLVDEADYSFEWLKTSGDQWYFAFTGLRAEKEGQKINYVVKEKLTGGYTAENETISVTSADGKSAVAAFEAVYGTGNSITDAVPVITNTPLGSLSGTKVWKDNGNSNNTRPDAVSLTLYSKVEGSDKASEVKRVPTWTKGGTGAEDTWYYTYDKLPQYTADGKRISYYVKEVVNEDSGYVPAVNGTEIINKLTAKTEISVAKKWIDNNNQLGYRPESIQIQLYGDGVKVGNPVTLSATTSGVADHLGDLYEKDYYWSYTYTDLDKYNEEGREIDYTVEEVSQPDHYATSVEEIRENQVFKITNTVEGIARTSFQGEKILDGRDVDINKTFRFRVLLIDGSTEEEVRTVRNKGSIISFGDFIFDKEGTYVYKVEEIDDRQKGMTYDDTAYFVRFLVEKVDGNLTITQRQYAVVEGEETPSENDYKSFDEDKKLSFNNVYRAEGQIQIGAVKTLVGQELTDGKFSFQLDPVDPLTGEAIGTSVVYKNKGSEIQIDPLKYNEAGTYYYKLREKNEGLGGIRYDNSVYFIKVEVVDDGEGKLYCEAFFWKGNSKSTVAPALVEGYKSYEAGCLSFENEYTTEGASISHVFDVEKVLEGRKFTEDDVFTFTLEGTGIDTPYEVDLTKDVKESSFEPIVFTKEGTYTFTVKEKIPEGKQADEDIAYDDTVYTAEVKVFDNGEGGFDKTVTYSADGGEKKVYDDNKTAFLFQNTYYEPVSIPLTITKTYRNADTQSPLAIQKGQFSFKLEALTKDAPLPENTRVETEDGFSGQVILFGNITYGLKDVGKTYSYKIVEETKDSLFVTYDDSVLTVNVVVKENEDSGKIETEVTYMNDGKPVEYPRFENLYTPPKETSVQLSILKQYKDTKGNSIKFGDEVFTFEIEAIGDAPPPEEPRISTTKKELSEERLNFDKIIFDEDLGEDGKVYRYQISEVAGTNGNISYSKDVFTVDIRISKTSKNELQVDEITYYKNGEPLEKGVAVTYVNVWNEDVSGFPTTGDSMSLWPWLALMGVSIVALIGIIIGRRKK